MLKRIWNRVGESRRPTRASTRARAISQWDSLESRRLMTSGPTDYVLSGESWANPSKITYSFPPDGTPWDGGTNDLNAVMSADYPAGNWQRIIAEALQTWASVANINVVPVADGGEPFNTTGLTQGDPRFGDIRVGGYNFDSSTVLAQSYNPPPNGITARATSRSTPASPGARPPPTTSTASCSTRRAWRLGMGETTVPTAVMNRIYGGVRFGLEPVDINGIQAIYGPRLPDQYQAAGAATSAATAYDVSGGLATIAPGVEQATLFGVSLDAIGDTEYFSVVAPAGGSPETLYAIANSQGISSLSPKVTIYNTSMQPLGTAGDPDAWSDRQYATATGLVPGQRYIIAVTGATGDVFSVGDYAFQLIFKGISAVTPPPTVPKSPPPPPPANPLPPPPPPTAPGAPSPTLTAEPSPPIARDRFEPNNTAALATNLGTLTSTVVTGLTFADGLDVQAYSFVPKTSGTVVVSTGTSTLWVVNSAGQTVATGAGQVTFPAPTAGSRFWIAIGPINGQTNPGFSMAITVVPSETPAQQVVAPAVDNLWTTPLPTPAPTPAPVVTPPASTWQYARLAAERPPRPLSRVSVVNPRWVQLGLSAGPF